MTKEFQKTLRHDDFTITTDLCTSVMWMETMVGSLAHLRNSKHRYYVFYVINSIGYFNLNLVTG